MLLRFWSLGGGFADVDLSSAAGVPVPPRVVSASSASGNGVFTIADMSPDTGVYAVQWVTQGDDFNSYQMMRATSKTITVPYLACTRSYTLRVFVMAANWQLADGHQTQNVTAHSPTFDLTMPACTNVTSLSCAQGGTCVVGDTGPGGGIVFYVAGSNFTSTGSDCGTSCRYMEAAPAASEVRRSWATNVNTPSNQITAVTRSNPSADATAIGSGYQNTVDIKNQTGNVAATSAAVYAFDYTNNGKSDWHLPSKNELNQMYLRKGTIAARSSDFYWSSSEDAANFAWLQEFLNSYQHNTTKGDTHYVRPVRAFG